MKKALWMMFSLAMLGMIGPISTSSVYAADNTDVVKKAGKPQTLCPIMGDEIDKKLFVDYAGKRIYVCCKMCLKKVQQDPAKYIKQLEDDGIEPETVPTDK